ncbi:MAG: hypothetical protein MJA82_02275 [Clostridia bacterium]|nr:hypothetical protein [Clostridia bacterium]
MGSPNYIANLNEFLKALVQGYSSMKLMNNGIQKSKGLFIENSILGDWKVTWAADHDMLITGVSFGVDNIRNIGYDDNWDMYVDDLQIMSSVYVKEINEYKGFSNFYPVLKGQTIGFIFHNLTNISKDLWFDIDYIETDIPAIEVVVISIDRLNNTELQRFNTFYRPPISARINAPSINGYVSVGTTEELITIDMNTPSPQEVIFYYEPQSKEVVIICLDQDTGRELSREVLIILPPTMRTFRAPVINGYRGVGDRTQTIEISLEDISPIELFFYYELEQKTVNIIYINQDTGVEISRAIRVYTPPARDTINAPTLAGYNLVGEDSYTIKLDIDSPILQEVIFFYEEVSTPPIVIPHAYDYKIVLRWEGNVGTDMDLHVYFDHSPLKHLYYGNPKLEVDSKNKAWHDIDHLEHRNSDDYDKRPEITTILGKPYDTANIKVHAFSGEKELSQDLAVEIYKVDEKGIDILQRIYTFPSSIFKNVSKTYYVCDIDLTTDVIRSIEKSLFNLDDF